MANGMIMGDYQIISSGNHVLKQKMQLFFGTGVCKDTLQSNTAMIRLTPLRKRPALSALVLLLMGSGFCQAQEMLTDSARKEASEWLKEVKAGYLNTSSSRIQKAVAALTAATSTENAAMKLYVDAMKDRFLNPTSMMSRMLNRGGGFRMMRMPGSGGKGGNSSKPDSPSTAFSNWRKQNTGNNVAPGFKKAL